MTNLEYFYQRMHPKIDPEFPVAKDENEYENELIAGHHKVLRGFRVLNELCKWTELGEEGNELTDIREYDSLDPLFPSFAHSLADDVSFVTSCFVDFKPDQSVDLVALYTEVIDYLERVLEENRLWGDFLDRISATLIHLAMCSPEIEDALFIAWILDFNNPSGERSNEFYSFVFEELDRRMTKDSDLKEVLVERFYVGALIVSIVATDDDVEFIVDGWPSGFVKGEWDDEYIYDRIYRNDKRSPDSKEEWLALMAPESGKCLKLGSRSYKTLEDALKRERLWVAGVGSFFR